MSPGILFSNVLAYSAQVLALVAAGTLLRLVLRVGHPRFHLVSCQLLLAGCFLLPLLQPWHRPLLFVPRPLPPEAGIPSVNPSPPAEHYISMEEVALLVLAAGASLRILWIFVGLWRLRRYRTEATQLDVLPPPIEAAWTRTGANASVYVSEAIEGPVTFGVFSPVVLVPRAILDQPGGHQFAVACHEFVHVRRRDWLFTACEEVAGALLWFHPAIWWLLSQIRLCREQVVDRDVVALIESRDHYVDVLLAIAGVRPRLDFAPPFLRTRQLKQRIRSLLKEVSVSKRRLVSSYAAIATVFLLTAWIAVISFPLKGSSRTYVASGDPSEDARAPWLEPGVRSLVDSFVYAGIPPAEVVGRGGHISRCRHPLVLFAMTSGQSPASRISVVRKRTVGRRPASAGPFQLRLTGTLHESNVSNLPEPLRESMRSRLARYERRRISWDLIQEVNDAASDVHKNIHITWILGPAPEVSVSLCDFDSGY